MTVHHGEHLFGPVNDEEPIGQSGQVIMEGLVADLVNEACIGDRDCRLTRQTPEPQLEICRGLQAFGSLRHVHGDPTQELVVQFDRKAGDEERPAVPLDGSNRIVAITTLGAKREVGRR
jgi:hypothetical protein